MRRLLALCGVVGLTCGAPKPGPQPNVTYFWNITSSSLEWGAMCSDDAAFRAGVTPLEFDANSYLIYKVNPDGKKAVTQDCTHVDPATCLPSDAGVVLDVAGVELSYSAEDKRPTPVGTCSVLDTQQWTLTDKNTTLDVVIADTLSLVDDPTGCATIESDAKANAPNGMGYQGCVVNYKLAARLALPYR